MPEGDVARPAGQQPGREEEPERLGFSFKTLAMGAIFYFGVNVFVSWVMAKNKGGGGETVQDPATGQTVAVPANMNGIPAFQLRPKELDPGATYQRLPKSIAPIWSENSHLDIVVTLSTSPHPVPISQVAPEYRVLDERDFHMNNYSDKRSVDTTFPVPEAVQKNGTLWGHFYIGLTGSVLDPYAPGFDSDRAYHVAQPLTQYLPKKKIVKTRNLLDDMPSVSEYEKEEGESADASSASGGRPVIANYYHQNASFAFVPDLGVKDFATLVPSIRNYLRLEATGARDGTGQHGWYYPLLYVNTFWQLKTHMTLLNETVTELPLHIDLGNLANWKFMLMSSIEMNSKENARQAAFGHPVPGSGDGSEIEMVKEIFIDTNPILLGITAVVSVAHMVLETLAFGSDIAHYRKKKDNVGISVRSILANVFMQAVIFLYLLDNSQNTSWMILGSQVVGIVIEFWKITTVVNVRLRPTTGNPGAWLPYTLAFEDKHRLTETEEKTKEYDEIAFRYMYVAAAPLLIAYGAYSLVYESHKSWYSFVITTLVGSVYAYGFLMMVPSLYINYRLKSVAHMPAKAMMYKFLNTFIDDLFAFTIKMPFLHRLATFRDDVIFFVYLYQRWAYRIDYTRVNEFGQGGDDEDGKEKKAGAETSVTSVDAGKDAGKKGKASGVDAGSASKRR